MNCENYYYGNTNRYDSLLTR